MPSSWRLLRRTPRPAHDDHDNDSVTSPSSAADGDFRHHRRYHAVTAGLLHHHHHRHQHHHNHRSGHASHAQQHQHHSNHHNNHLQLQNLHLRENTNGHSNDLAVVGSTARAPTTQTPTHAHNCEPQDDAPAPDPFLTGPHASTIFSLPPVTAGTSVTPPRAYPASLASLASSSSTTSSFSSPPPSSSLSSSPTYAATTLAGAAAAAATDRPPALDPLTPLPGPAYVPPAAGLILPPLPPLPPSILSAGAHPADKTAHASAREAAASRTPSAASLEGLNEAYKRDVIALRNDLGPRLVIVMVYLSWCGFRVRLFNVGNRRRELAVPCLDAAATDGDTVPPAAAAAAAVQVDSSPAATAVGYDDVVMREDDVTGNVTVPNGEHSPVALCPVPGTTHDASFFDSGNESAKQIREQLAMETLEELISWLNAGGKVAIHDATNSTVERRRAIVERVRREKNLDVVFIESICTDQAVIDANVTMKLSGPDYRHMPPDVARRDFLGRMTNYERVYETLGKCEEDAGTSFIKLENVGKKVIGHGIRGFLQSQCVFYLMQIHIKKRYNLVERIGGDAPLTDLGTRYAAALARFVGSQPRSPASTGAAVSDASEDGPRDASDFQVWTSTLQRAIDTAAHFDSAAFEVSHLKSLNEINAGICEHMAYSEIEKAHPDLWLERQRNRLLFRYPGPGGESYL
ncbi:hypothetical protein HK405_008793, partial [Cladochytrium tenue]